MNATEHDMEMMEECTTPKKRTNTWIFPVIVVLLCIIVALSYALWHLVIVPKEVQAQVDTEISLEKIVQTSDLSTFKATYNGIATVMNEKKPEKVDYYVSYEASVYAGIDFSKVRIDVDKENLIVNVSVPPVDIQDIVVDIESLDFIFYNKKANKSTVSKQAYDACVADVYSESEHQEAIRLLAEENAKNVLRALLQPAVSQLQGNFEINMR